MIPGNNAIIIMILALKQGLSKIVSCTVACQFVARQANRVEGLRETKFDLLLLTDRLGFVSACLMQCFSPSVGPS